MSGTNNPSTRTVVRTGGVVTNAAPPPSDSLLVALVLLEAGQIPVPMRAGTKAPLVRWTALRDRGGVPTEAEVRSWWRRWPDAGVARVIPAGQVVLDVDPRNDGLESLAELPAEVRAAVERSVVVWSGRNDGGRHAWFRVPDDLQLQKGEIAAGLDLLPAGNLEILPPSIHADTHLPYRWADGADLDALEYLPALPLRTPTRTTHHAGPGRPGGGPPMTAEHQAEFRGLWASVGLELRTGEALYRCPLHDDATPSLSIHAERGVWACHAGCGGGGLRDLRDRLGPRRASVPLGRPKGPEISRQTSAPAARSCPNAVPVAYRQGRQVVVRAVDCGMRACPVCGPRLAVEVAAPILADLEAEALVLHEMILDDAQLRAWKLRVDRRGHRRKQFPAHGGRWRVFTTCADEGTPVEDPQVALLEAHAVAAVAGLPSSTCRRRNITGSRCWAVTHRTAETETTALEQDGWILIGVVTASDTWALRQAERITGSRPQVVADGQGRPQGYTFLLSADEAEAQVQLHAWCVAAGVTAHADLRALRTRTSHGRVLAVAVAA